MASGVRGTQIRTFVVEYVCLSHEIKNFKKIGKSHDML